MDIDILEETAKREAISFFPLKEMSLAIRSAVQKKYLILEDHPMELHYKIVIPSKENL